MKGHHNKDRFANRTAQSQPKLLHPETGYNHCSRCPLLPPLLQTDLILEGCRLVITCGLGQLFHSPLDLAFMVRRTFEVVHSQWCAEEYARLHHRRLCSSAESPGAYH